MSRSHTERTPLGTAVAERLKAHRKNETQYKSRAAAASAIAERFGEVGLGDQTLKRIENGQSPITLDYLAILCEFYELSLMEVIETASTTVEIAKRHAAQRQDRSALPTSLRPLRPEAASVHPAP